MTGICIAPTKKAEVAFAELHETWTSDCGTWRIVAKVESVDSLPKYKVRTTVIFKRNIHTLRYASIQPNGKSRIPDYVLNKYDELISLAREVR